MKHNKNIRIKNKKIKQQKCHFYFNNFIRFDKKKRAF